MTGGVIGGIINPGAVAQNSQDLLGPAWCVFTFDLSRTATVTFEGGSMVNKADNSPSDSKGDDFAAVLAKEHESIRTRRRANGILSQASDESPTQNSTDRESEAPPELFGIALSGGGIRSASFCLGALQALDQFSLIGRVDYLSTVSGGGYIGASMVAAMSAGPAGIAEQGEVEFEAKAAGQVRGGSTDHAKGQSPKSRDSIFPFASGAGQDVRDNVAVGHVRDHSRFLAPKGFGDILLSGAILMRGLMVNLLLLLTVLLPLATMVIVTNPTTGHLDHSIWLDIARWFYSDWDKEFGKGIVGSIVADPLVMTKGIAALLAISLVAWALWRSFVESFYGKFGSSTLEHESRWTQWGRYLLVSLLVALLVELQPRIVAAFIAPATKGGVVEPGITGIKALVVSATAIVAATATFRGTLIAWIQKALSSPTISARLQAFFARAAFYALGLALPLLIYGLFLLLIISGMKVESCPGCTSGYLFGPGFLAPRTGGWSLF
ncbi:DNA translocase FtsK 4TM domain-containing protein [Allomesorhizobium alhagi]|uniref:DNA translocase FtsK 4TM domain-containing protein n=1 Tax=Allomesorhizobium alhagi TaxID=475067 RepID=UPI0002F6429B|nr:DNA translocase FtsK 4TM domain-containing protein [Mesorhizobium alhagi]